MDLRVFVEIEDVTVLGISTMTHIGCRLHSAKLQTDGMEKMWAALTR